MAERWFDAMQWAWLPGTLLGVLGGLWGSLAGVLAPKGKARPGGIPARISRSQFLWPPDQAADTLLGRSEPMQLAPSLVVFWFFSATRRAASCQYSS
jgi:hypothetical protein